MRRSQGADRVLSSGVDSRTLRTWVRLEGEICREKFIFQFHPGQSAMPMDVQVKGSKRQFYMFLAYIWIKSINLRVAIVLVVIEALGSLELRR